MVEHHSRIHPFHKPALKAVKCRKLMEPPELVLFAELLRKILIRVVEWKWNGEEMKERGDGTDELKLTVYIHKMEKITEKFNMHPSPRPQTN